MSGLRVVHLVYNALRDFPDRYSLCTHSLSEHFSSDFGELYRYVQKVYENAVHCRLLYMVGRTAVSGLGVVHLVYNALRHLPSRYSLCTHSLTQL